MVCAYTEERKKALLYRNNVPPSARSGHSAAEAEAAAALRLPRHFSPPFNSGCGRRDSRPAPGDHGVMRSGATRHRGLLVWFPSSVAAGVVLSLTTQFRVFSVPWGSGYRYLLLKMTQQSRKGRCDPLGLQGRLETGLGELRF